MTAIDLCGQMNLDIDKLINKNSEKVIECPVDRTPPECGWWIQLLLNRPQIKDAEFVKDIRKAKLEELLNMSLNLEIAQRDRQKVLDRIDGIG